MSKILILDDDQYWLEKHLKHLKNAGFECETTQSGADAISKLCSDESFKVALIDEILKVSDGKNMQDQQGSDVIDAVKQSKTRQSEILFIKITEYIETETEKLIEKIVEIITTLPKKAQFFAKNKDLVETTRGIVRFAVKYTQKFDREKRDLLSQKFKVKVVQKPSLKGDKEITGYDDLIEIIKDFLENKQIYDYLKDGFCLVEFGVFKSEPNSDIWGRILGKQEAEKAINNHQIIAYNYDKYYDIQSNKNQQKSLFICFVKCSLDDSDIDNITETCKNLRSINHHFLVIINHDIQDEQKLESVKKKFRHKINLTFDQQSITISSYNNEDDILKLTEKIKEQLEYIDHLYSEECSRNENIKKQLPKIIKETINEFESNTELLENSKDRDKIIITMMSKICYLSEGQRANNGTEAKKYENKAKIIYEDLKKKKEIKKPCIMWTKLGKICIDILIISVIIGVILLVLVYKQERIELIITKRFPPYVFNLIVTLLPISVLLKPVSFCVEQNLSKANKKRFSTYVETVGEKTLAYLKNERSK